MDRINSRIAQIYGYAVCLICVVVILISASQVMNGAFDYANPLASGMASGRFGAFSYEAYRMQHREIVARPTESGSAVETPLTDSEMRNMYQTEKDEAIASSRYRALRTLVSGTVFLLLGTTMFLLHWRWIRRTNAEAVVG